MSTNTPTTKTDETNTPSGKFTEFVFKEYSVATGENNVPQDVRRRIQNYFVKIDMILQENENKRLKTPESTRSKVEFIWKNINLTKLAVDVMIYATLGLDPLMPNHINPIPYLNGKTSKFDFGFIKGYKGLEIIARTFGVNPPKEMIVELVYSNDEFIPIKRDMETSIEWYRFRITNPFNRGTIIGGFIYHSYDDKTLNRLEMLSLHEIEKRKPKYASAEFWGGEKKTYANGKISGSETIEGWHAEMCTKTLYRKGWDSITIDGQKVNALYENVVREELETETLDAELLPTDESQEKPKTISIAATEKTVEPMDIEETQKPEKVVKSSATTKKESSDLGFPESE